jgi:hypothetical protein
VTVALKSIHKIGTEHMADFGQLSDSEDFSEEQPDEPVSEEQSDEPASEEPSSELVPEEPSSEPVSEEPGSKQVSEEPGSEQVSEEPGSENESSNDDPMEDIHQNMGPIFNDTSENSEEELEDTGITEALEQFTTVTGKSTRKTNKGNLEPVETPDVLAHCYLQKYYLKETSFQLKVDELLDFS